MAITCRLAGTACPVTKSGAQTVLFAGWDLDWEWVSDANAAGNWYVYNVTRSAGLALNGNITGAESTGYTATVTGDASAWSTGDLCFISNNATVAVHATIAAEVAAAGYLDTCVLCYATATYRPHFKENMLQTTKPQHLYGHLSGQRCFVGTVTISGDQSANNTQVVWRNFHCISALTYNDTGAGKTGGGFKVRRIIGTYNTNVFLYVQAAGANVCQFEFCFVWGINSGYGAYVTAGTGAAKFYHCTVRDCSTQGFANNSTASTYQNCVAIDCGTDFAGKATGTYTKCASSDATGSEVGLQNLTRANCDFWGENQGQSTTQFSCRILTTSSLYNAGTAVAGLTTDIDGNDISAIVPVGCHKGTVNAYGVTWPTAAQTEVGVSFINFSATVTGTFVGEAHTANQVVSTAGGNWNIANLTPGNVLPVAFGLGQVGTFDEVGRNTIVPGQVQDGENYLHLGIPTVGEYDCPGVTMPICLGAIDAAPYVQGLIKVRFYEMICIDGAPYRYDFHIKPLLDGPLTEAEINAGTYYSISVYQPQINASLYTSGTPFGDPGIAEVALAIEALEDAGDNVSPFTNQQYQVAVRAVAINGNTIAEDDNTEVVTSYSNGYQGTTSIHITDWPCLELCTPIDLSNVQITALPDVNIASLPELEFAEPLEMKVLDIPNLNVHLFRPPKGG